MGFSFMVPRCLAIRLDPTQGAEEHVTWLNSLKDWLWLASLMKRFIHVWDAACLLSFYLFFCNYRDIWLCFIINFHKLGAFGVGCLEWNNQGIKWVCIFIHLFANICKLGILITERMLHTFKTLYHRGPPKPLLNLNGIIPWPRDNFSIDGEPETQKVSALTQHGNGNSSRKNLGQNIFAKRGKESTRIIKIR